MVEGAASGDRSQPPVPPDSSAAVLNCDVQRMGPLGSAGPSRTAASKADSNVPHVPGVGSLPVMRSSSGKVQEWLSSSISDRFDSTDHAVAASSDATLAGATIGSTGLGGDSPADNPQSGGIRGSVAARQTSTPSADALLLQQLAVPTETPLPGQAAPSNPSSDVNEVPDASRLDEGRVSGLPGSTLAESGRSFIKSSNHGDPTDAIQSVSARAGSHVQQRPPAVASAPVNGLAGIDNVLSLLRQHTASAYVMADRNQSQEDVMQDVSAVVSSMHNHSTLSSLGTVVDNGAGGASTADRLVREEPADAPISLLAPAPPRAIPPLSSLQTGAVAMPEMHKQIAKMFFMDGGVAPGDSGQVGGSVTSDAQSGWSPPSLAAKEQDGLSSSSSMSIITPLRVHADAAAQPYTGAPLPSVETDRMEHLCSLNVLSTAPERRFDRLTALTATVRCPPGLRCPPYSLLPRCPPASHPLRHHLATTMVVSACTAQSQL